jgi:hypothetical protein
MELEITRQSERKETELPRKKTLTRPELMEKATDLIDLLHGRTTAKTFRARQDDAIRLQYARTTIQALAAYGTILKDADLEELKTRLDEIEARRT